jgi:hypothetical protein
MLPIVLFDVTVTAIFFVVRPSDASYVEHEITGIGGCFRSYSKRRTGSLSTKNASLMRAMRAVAAESELTSGCHFFDSVRYAERICSGEADGTTPNTS